MTEQMIRQLLSSLLAEKDIPLSGPAGEDEEEATPQLLRKLLSPEAGGALPDDVAHALLRAFDAAGKTGIATAGEGKAD